MQKKWRLIEDIEDNGAKQMAIDETIARARAKNQVPNTLRFFTWKPACVTIGYFQSLEKEVDKKKAKEADIDIIRRYTGGGAVLHEFELTYSIVLSENDVPSDIIESYKIICNAIVEGFKLLNINAQFKEINDIIVNNKKISGNAQTRMNGVVLQHGTILIDVDVDKMFSILKVPDEKIRDKMIETVKDRVTSLKKESEKEISIQELRQAMIKGFEKVFNVGFEEQKLSEEEMSAAEDIYNTKYSTDEWNNKK